MHNRGTWSTPACPRNCGHAKEYTPHILQCKKGDDTWEKLKKTLVIWGIKNRAEPTLIPALLHDISLWRKGHLPLLPPYLPTQVESAFKKQNNIGWLQALTGILAHEWAETQNINLQYLGDKVTGRRWVSSLIRKLWYIAWDMWNYRNHTLHASDDPTKAAVLTHANARISYHFNHGTMD